MTKHLVLACVLFIGAGCHVALNDPGTEPPAAQLYFPAGVLVDPVEPILYVSNNNSDLNYGGGTVQMIDLERFSCAEQTFRAQQNDPLARPLPPTANCSTAATDAQACVYDPLDPAVVDCDSTNFILGDQTVKVGNFAGNMVMLDKGNDHRQLFVGVRGDPSITWIDAYPGATLGSHGKRLECFDDATNVSGATTPPPCSASHQLQFYNCQNQPNCMLGDGTYPPGVQLIPIEPFGLGLDQGKLADGSDYARVLVSHLEGGQVTLIDALNLTDPNAAIPYVSNPFFMPDPSMNHGAFALAPQVPGQGANTLWYMTSNTQPNIATFRVADNDLVVPATQFTINGALAGGGDIRSAAFSADGNVLYLTEGNPPSVLVVDTRPSSTPNQPLQNNNQLLDVIDVCLSPSHLQEYTINWQGPAGTPPIARTRLYVMCFLSNQVMVVDPARGAVDDTILVGRGPNDIAFATGGPVLPSLRAYVTNFSESTIGVLDLEPGSPTENRMVARIGLPVPPPMLNPTPVF